MKDLLEHEKLHPVLLCCISSILSCRSCTVVLSLSTFSVRVSTQYIDLVWAGIAQGMVLGLQGGYYGN